MCEKCDNLTRAALQDLYPEKTSQDIEEMVQANRETREKGIEEISSFVPAINALLDRHGHDTKGFAIALEALGGALGMLIAKLPGNLHKMAFGKAGEATSLAINAYADQSPPDDPEADDMLERIELQKLRHAVAGATRH